MAQTVVSYRGAKMLPTVRIALRRCAAGAPTGRAVAPARALTVKAIAAREIIDRCVAT